jgi:hypothetical protein
MANPKFTNNAFVVFHMGDHLYNATVTNFDSLVGWLTSSYNTPVACLGVEFTRGSKYFKRQIKQVLKATFNKRIPELTWQERVELSEAFNLH